VGIRQQHSNMIASAMQQWAEERQHAERQQEASGRGAEDAAKKRAGVTLAVEGNISAGKSTFLDVLSHEQTALNNMLTVSAGAGS